MYPTGQTDFNWLTVTVSQITNNNENVTRFYRVLDSIGRLMGRLLEDNKEFEAMMMGDDDNDDTNYADDEGGGGVVVVMMSQHQSHKRPSSGARGRLWCYAVLYRSS